MQYTHRKKCIVFCLLFLLLVVCLVLLVVFCGCALCSFAVLVCVCAVCVVFCVVLLWLVLLCIFGDFMASGGQLGRLWAPKMKVLGQFLEALK